jgi:hypothetical protein
MKKLTLFAFILSACINIHSQTWQTFGVPPGGGVTDLVYWKGVGANFSDKVWVSTSSYNWPTGQWGGVYYSATTAPYQGVWYQVAAGYIARTLAAGQDGKLYASIWYDPAFQVADGLYRFNPQAGVFGILYQASAGDNIFSIAVKNSPHTIFAGTRNGVIRSIDNGVSFGYSNSGIPDSAWAYDIAIDSSGILAIASSKGVFISTDNGDNWQQVSDIPPEDTVRTITFSYDTTTSAFMNKTAVVRQEGSTLNACTDNGKIFKISADSFFTFLAHLFEPIAEVSNYTAYIKSYAGLRLKIIENEGGVKFNDIGGVYESIDNGINWRQINDGLPPEPPVSSLALKVINETSAELYAGLFNDTTGGAGVYKLTVIVGVEEDDSQIPSKYYLEQNYPNPFNPSTTIDFSIPEQSFVKLEVFNTLGEKVSTLVSEELNTGNYKYEWNADNLSSGIYLYRLQTTNYSESRKMILLR